MNNMQAAKLPIGACIRRKGAGEDAERYRVEGVELPKGRKKGDVTIHAGGHTFKAWEIERSDERVGWPVSR